RLNGVNYFEKPPLMYWATAISERVFGKSEWSVRFMNAFVALLGVLFTYVTARKVYGRTAGVGSAIVLGTSAFYFGLSNFLVLDMAVSVLMSATLFCFILGVREAPGASRRWFFYGLYISAALATLTKGFIGFLLTGAVMFVWLLVFNQWKRLRPLYLPTGLLIFLIIATPWHILVALRNETWVHRYIVYEHWLRFSTSAASRVKPWSFFIPIILGGLFPWVGFLWASIKETFAGGWAARKSRADAWFFATWVIFIFLFFSTSKSKLAPYILPVFPALAVLIGPWLASQWNEVSGRKLRLGLNVFAFFCGLLAVALLAVVIAPARFRIDPTEAAPMQPFVYALAFVLLTGGVLTPWLGRNKGPRPALRGLVVTIAVFFVIVACAGPAIEKQKPGTKKLALIVKERALPGDRVMHYHEFFHDFTFYAERVVDLVSFKGELELEEDAAAEQSGRFPNEQEFLRDWNEPRRIFLVARKKDADEKRATRDYTNAVSAWKRAEQAAKDKGLPFNDAPPQRSAFADPDFHYYLIGETEDHYLFSNKP
ncbi:MAG TPA: glycosyltransferase family 39 protein, partial [Opitutaceae bacterium]|nr:glycosyltransferase family 39 protein [Opitutaceae bacterium]